MVKNKIKNQKIEEPPTRECWWFEWNVVKKGNYFLRSPCAEKLKFVDLQEYYN
jgi:hypothetical protein